MATSMPQKTKPDSRSWWTRRKHDREEAKAHAGRFEYWLKYKSWKWIAAVFVLYMISGFGIGFVAAWEILVGRDSAKDAGWPAATWPLSIMGWILVPAFIGGATGYVVTSQIESRRVHSMEDAREMLLEEARNKNKPPQGSP